MVVAATKRVTLDEFINLPDEGKGYELINGELVEIEVSSKSHYVAGLTYAKILNFITPKQLGWAFPPETGFACFSDDANRLRKPDAAFISASKLSAAEYANSSYLRVVPDLVAEVVSPNDTVYASEAKRDQWLKAGVSVVWIINPDSENADIYKADGSKTYLRNDGILTADPILPGFALPVADLFKLPI
jgi:Uma2 family endonuclease